MKASNGLLGITLALWILPSTEICAQFYAPDTEYHDPVQRVFVVELARTLGWLARIHGTNFTEVVYQLTTKPEEVTWEIRWLGSDGKTAKTAKVSYPKAALKTGADFYRSVFKQMWLAGWTGLSPMAAGETSNLFWEGAARMGNSREESLQMALELVPASKTNDWTWLPRLAGLLTHASLPSTSDRLTLDNLILARGAAWLALAEQVSAVHLNDLWTPVLFQAGREKVAAETWAKAHPAKLERPTLQQAGWNLWLRKPTSKEVFLFAAESTNLSMAMPMLAYDVMVNGTGRQLAELIPDLAGSPERLSALHNYAPLFATRTSIGGGHILEGSWAVLARHAWLQLLAAYHPAPGEYRGYEEPIRAAMNLLRQKTKRDPDTDGSLIGFPELAPLLRLAHTEGTGVLVPTAVVTSRDLLNYGWESAGLQLGARHRFVARRWGVRELGEQIFQAVTVEVDGLMPFFKRAADAKIHNYPESLLRLEAVDGFFQLVGFSDPPFEVKDSKAEGPRLFVKRAWLRPREFEWQVRALWDGDAIGDIPALAEALREQGGDLAAATILTYLDTLDKQSLAKIPNGGELMYSLAETLPQPSSLYVRSVYTRKYGGTDNFDRAQEIEKLYWQNPDSGLEDRVFRNYLVANAFDSSRRFYTQCRENILDPVAFSGAMGRTAFVAGYCLNDAAMRRMALEDSRSGSYADMIMHIWDAAIRDDAKDLERNTSDLVDRYESDEGVMSRGRRLLKFLPLLPALRDAKHSEHKEALRYFGKDDSWVVLRWIWIEKFKLMPEDGIALLGGRETGLFQRTLVCYLEKDQPGMLDALNKFTASRNIIDENSMLAMFLYGKIHPRTPRKDTDLKPANAVSIRRAVSARLKASRP